MYLLGLSGGRKMGNSEAFLRAALMGAKEVEDIEVELIRLMDLNVKPPLGEHARGQRQTDHASFLNKKLRESDGIIFSAPSYALTPPGFVINIRDRVSLRGLPDKIRPAGMIGVGGSDWTSLMLPLMYTVLPHGECKIVDQMLINFEAHLGQVVMNDKAMERAKQLGRNVAEAMHKPISEAEYLGEEYSACPLCQQNLLLIRGKQVECSICDVRGTLEITDDGIKVNYTDEDLKTYRWGPDGAKRHRDVISQQGEPYKKNLPEIEKRLTELEAFLPVTTPPGEELEPPRPEPAEEAHTGPTLLDV
jgi:multimeric flavodoxin WrbA